MACGSGCCSRPPARATDAEPGTSGLEASAPMAGTGTTRLEIGQETAEVGMPDACCAGDTVSEDASCKDGCCAVQPQPAAAVPDAEACQDGCCADEEPAASVRNGVADGCCAGEEETPGPNPGQASCRDACCAEKQPAGVPKAQPDSECEDACCSGKDSAANAAEDPDCCRGKPSPCCDDACLDRLAARECRKPSGDCEGKSDC